MLEFRLTSDSTSSLSLWMTVLLVLSLILCLVYLGQILMRRRVLAGGLNSLCKLLVAILACLQLLAWQMYYYRQSHDTVAVWCFVTAICGGFVLWQISNRLESWNPKLNYALPFVLAAVSLAEFAGFAQATKFFREPLVMLEMPAAGVLVDKSTAFAMTDRGTPIFLSERQIDAEAYQACIANQSEIVRQLADRAMLRGQATLQANCHGWVFTQGEHILRGEMVQSILDDNGYKTVTDPAANDVAVYRNVEGAIMHTGLVRGFIEGATIVESKWGIGALYMHIAEEQPYSKNISYWRTQRGSHAIRIESSPTSATLDSPSLARVESSTGLSTSL